MAENATTPARAKPAIPQREPSGMADWRVTIRHSPLIAKRFVVKAKSREDAWAKCLQEIEAHLTEKNYDKKPNQLASGRAWLAMVRKLGPDDSVEIIGDEYAAKRRDALRVRGTVSVDQIGFPELASA